MAGTVVPSLTESAAAEPTTQQDPLVLTYGAPAPLNGWQEESLPIGNGALGTSVFGQVTADEHPVGETFVRETGWHFNNLSYLPLMKRQAWANNPLGVPGTFTSDDRRWRTECDTANTGRGGCRSYIWTLVVDQTSTPSGWQFDERWDWVFNNQVSFSR
ncbi:glycoside hydrolase family 95 protein [Tessaracoccus rhinocerotis]|nr:glycoside hydrolase family 95 protein [Tessaracoccus rhinocerotis]